MGMFKDDVKKREAEAKEQAKETQKALAEQAKVQAEIDKANKKVSDAEMAKADILAEHVGLQPEDNSRKLNDFEARRDFNSPDEMIELEGDRQEAEKLRERGRKEPYEMKPVSDIKKKAAKRMDANLQSQIDDAAADGKSSLEVDGRLDHDIRQALHRAGYQTQEVGGSTDKPERTRISWEA